jgi:hypothetical protein
MMCPRPRFITVLALTLGVTACNDAVQPAAPLASAEISQLAAAILLRFRALSVESGSPLTLAGRRAGDRSVLARGPHDSITVVLHSELSEPCLDDRGVARLSKVLNLRIDAETESGSADGNLVLSLIDCRVTTREGIHYVLTSGPDLTLHSEFQLANGEPVGGIIDGRLSGAFTWRRGGGGGHCTVDLEIHVAADAAATRAQGDFCDAPIDQPLW